MFEALVGGFLLTGTVCIQDGDRERDCRPIRESLVGSKYVCDQKRDFILERFPRLDPAQLGFEDEVKLRVHVRCSPQNLAGI